MNKTRFKNIDLLRIIGALTIVYNHIIHCTYMKTLSKDSILLQEIFYKAHYSALWVPFFFIIAGFFLFHYIDYTMKFIDFFKKKVIRLLPVIVFAIVLYWFLSLFTPLVYRKYINIFTIFFLNSIGLTGKDMGNIHPVWFVAVLFWLSNFYFYISKIYDKKYINLLMGVTPFFAYIFLLHTSGQVNLVFYNFIPRGILQGMGGIALGYWINEIYNLNKDNLKRQLSKLEYFLYGCLEGYLLYYIVRNTVFHRLGFMNFMPLIFVFLGLFYLFLIKRGFVSRLLENNFSVILGRYSYSIFVVHIIVLDLISTIIWKKHPVFTLNHVYLNIFIVLVSSFILGVIAYHLVEVPSNKFFKNLLLNNRKICDEGGKSDLSNNKFIKNTI